MIRALVLTSMLSAAALGAQDPVVVASKPFAESFVLAEMFAQILEARGVEVDRRPGLGATEVAFQALREGSVDVYPEYTGTGLLAILGVEATGSSREAFDRVSRDFRERWGMRWLPSLGFENTYAIAVRQATADSLGLSDLSDLAAVAPRLLAGLSPDFIGRGDGLPGLARVYGMSFREVRPLLQALKYQALAQGEVDVIDGYATDGQIARYDLVVLADDRSFFPPYDAAPLLGRRVSETRPDVVSALTELAGRMDEAFMRRLNARLDVEGDAVEDVARDALAELGLTGAVGSGGVAAPTSSSLVAYLWGRRAETLRLTLQHLLLVFLSLGAAIIVALPLGLLLERVRRAAEVTVQGVALLQTIPAIALLAFMIPFLGIGTAPAVVALFLYSLLPILRNTFAGVRDADPLAVGAARALGMTEGQLLTQVRLPLAAPVIMAGIRTAAVINVGTATLAAFIGAGGLGEPIVAGLALSDTRLILSGAIPAAALALLVEAALAAAEKALAPKGLGPSASG